MSKNFEIIAKSRFHTGKNSNRRLRHAGLVPGIIYGSGKKPDMISVKHNDLIHHIEQEAFYSHILEINIDGYKQKVVLKDLQRHPAKPCLLHLDFLRIKADEKLKIQVPIHFIGEDVSPGIKAGGTASHHLTEIEVSCFPADLPEYIEVNVSKMEIGDSLSLSDLILAEEIELPTLLSQGEDKVILSIISGRRTSIIEKEDEEEDSISQNKES